MTKPDDYKAFSMVQGQFGVIGCAILILLMKIALAIGAHLQY